MCSFVLLVRLKLSAALASKVHPAQTDHRARQAKTALPAKDPALQDLLVATQNSMSAFCRFLLSARARPPPAQSVLPAHLDQTAVRAIRVATDATERMVHPDLPDLPVQQVLQVVPAQRVLQENPALYRPVRSRRQVRPVNPADRALRDPQDNQAHPAKTATTVLQANLVSLVRTVHPAETASPDRPARRELQEPQEAAITAHQLVWPQDISLPASTTISPSIHLGWLLLLLSPIYTTKSSLR